MISFTTTRLLIKNISLTREVSFLFRIFEKRQMSKTQDIACAFHENDRLVLAVSIINYTSSFIICPTLLCLPINTDQYFQ